MDLQFFNFDVLIELSSPFQEGKASELHAVDCGNNTEVVKFTYTTREPCQNYI